MRGDLTIRKVKTASGATAVQVVRNEGKTRAIIKHVGSAHRESDLLMAEAVKYAEAHRRQPSLFPETPSQTNSPQHLDLSHAELVDVTHQFARTALFACARMCGLGALLPSRRLAMYCRRPSALCCTMSPRCTWKSFKEYDFQKPGFSKDNKPQQPQIVIGLITTRLGFPVMHEVFEGNTFEGKTMLNIVHRLQERVGNTMPVIVADAGMLSKANMQQLEADGYSYIVEARLASTASSFIETIHNELSRTDQASKRFSYSNAVKNASIICEFSEALYRKDKPFIFDNALQAKAEKLLGIKGYVTNIPESELSSTDVVAYYRDLWHVEQAFRMSKSDLKARPIFHHTKEAIRAHMLVCFMALMMGKYLEIQTDQSWRSRRSITGRPSPPPMMPASAASCGCRCAPLPRCRSTRARSSRGARPVSSSPIAW